MTSNTVELEDLSPEARRRRQASQATAATSSPNKGDTKDAVLRDIDEDGTIPSWSYATAAWLVILSLPFLAFPRFLLFLSSASGGEFREQLTPLENFLSTHFAIFALSIAIGLVISVPQESHISSRSDESFPPMILSLTGGMLLSSFLSYNTPLAQIGPLALFMCVGSGITGLWGLYVILFTGSSSRSRKTGADKRTSRFLFWNSSAASAQKKKWKKEQGKVRI